MAVPIRENKKLFEHPFELSEVTLNEICSDLTELNVTKYAIQVEDMADSNNEENETSRTGKSITIREDDKDRLEPGQLLNDTLVDFWMSW